MRVTKWLACVVGLTAAAAALGQINVGSDGSDGPLNITANTVIDLSLAPTASWDAPAPQPGYGVYDPNMWAVVFKYSSVNVAAGKVVTFNNHPSNAPVVWLVQTDVNIYGTVSLNGANGHAYYDTASCAVPGPGGFRGGRGCPSGAPSSARGGGFGPGGAAPDNGAIASGGSYGSAGAGTKAGPTYGTALVKPLVGGSGGAAAACPSGGGGAGGGAILIGANIAVHLRGSCIVRANGGAGVGGGGYQGGGGSGGAIRLVSDVIDIASNVTFEAIGGYAGYAGGMGRIRVEGNSITPSFPCNPVPSAGLPETIWPDASTPRIRSLTLDGQPVSLTPWGGLIYPYVDLVGQFPASSVLVFELANIPTTWVVKTRVTPMIGDSTTVTASYVSGDELLSTWQATLPMSSGVAAIQVRAAAQ